MHYDGISIAFDLCYGSIRAYTSIQHYWSIDRSAIVLIPFPVVLQKKKKKKEKNLHKVWWNNWNNFFSPFHFLNVFLWVLLWFYYHTVKECCSKITQPICIPQGPCLISMCRITCMAFQKWNFIFTSIGTQMKKTYFQWGFLVYRI